MPTPPQKDQTIIVYGSYGYTGALIVDELKAAGARVLLSGRKESALKEQSIRSDYPYQAVEIGDAAGLKQLLQRGAVVIHCAGPFAHTAAAMAEACLAAKTHYTDITGEYQVFEQLAGYDVRARSVGIQLMPGVGFDVVPSDCLALHLKQRLPEAEYLQLAFAGLKGGPSRGTAKTMIEGLGGGSPIRQGGKLVDIPNGSRLLDIDFGPFRSKAVCIPWGDIATAYRSTGIPNIEVYMAAPDKLIRQMRLSRYAGWLLRQGVVKSFLKKQIDKRPAGPSDKARESGRSYLWGRAWTDSGNMVVSRLETLNGYTLTAKTAALIAQKILKGELKTGYQTPAMAYGADLILEVEDTKRVDV
ncbi:saccharopine dehydrogenase family protein [Cesiribacter andamanensis]|uniref:Trans-acting enoyl reductase n=1 Tax=Cesiribacter andamanensis AMV16 TaxID=1279009 RepID=M7NZ37_9BACT|nr:saccharopine dehydrogenase NADP-binding domain-containing protein [Cesiribacter andamanensis]EMR03624.1 Trans-acting enoyl reductase [Cesiribacter andamanensis AMV16]